MAFSLFKEGKYSEAISELSKSHTEATHNVLIAQYYQSKAKDPDWLLEKLLSLPESSPKCSYNRAVLSYFKQHYGAVLVYLQPLYKSIDSIEDFLGIKICLLLIEACFALQMVDQAGKVLETLEASGLYSQLLKDAPEKGQFTPLLLGGCVEEEDTTEICRGEYEFLAKSLRCRYHILLNEAEAARKALNAAETAWEEVNPDDYDEEIFGHMHSQSVVMKHYLGAEIAYTEGNLNSTLVQLNQAQIDILAVLQGRSHPSCLPSKQRISHPIYHYNNLGCIHIRLGRAKLARFYFNQAISSLSSTASVDTSRPLYSVTSHSSNRRSELLYNSALSLLNSHKPKQALECLCEIAGLMQGNALFWYRMAQCHVLIHLQGLEAGRRQMLSDVVVSQNKDLLMLPAKATYSFKEEEEQVREETSLEKALKCLRNCLVVVKDEELKEYALLLQAFVCMDTQPQCALSSAQQLLHMDVSDSHRFIATVYAAEALLLLGKPRQAIEYLSHSPKELKLRCHSTLSPSAAVFSDEVSSKYVQSLNLASALLYANNLSQAVQSLNTAMNMIGLSSRASDQPSQPVPAPVINLAVYIALKQGNHKLATSIVTTRNVYAGMDFFKK